MFKNRNLIKVLGVTMTFIFTFFITTQEIKAESINVERFNIDTEEGVVQIIKKSYLNGDILVTVKEEDGSYCQVDYQIADEEMKADCYNYKGKNKFGGKKYEHFQKTVDVSDIVNTEENEIKTQASYGSKTYERWSWKYWYRSKWEGKVNYYSVGCNSMKVQPINYKKNSVYINRFKNDIKAVNSSMVQLTTSLGVTEVGILGSLATFFFTGGTSALIGAVVAIGGGATSIYYAYQISSNYDDVKEDFADLKHCGKVSYSYK
ncbi:MAG: ABC transporter ATP-binding protein [Eubacterium sp.]|nr:ABC transporter ATP-binding protein [Eubacterium sp.]